jgi:hypothetical protein
MLLGAAWFLLAFPARASGLRLSGLVQDPAGLGHALVEVEDPSLLSMFSATPTSGTFRVFRAGNGVSRVLTASRVSDGAEMAVTVLAFDQSGSFRGYRRQATQLAEQLVDALPSQPSYRVVVMTFATQLTVVGDATTASMAKTLLASAENAPSGYQTRLHYSIMEAITRAAQLQPAPKADRQIVVFTDAGEESGVYGLSHVLTAAAQNAARIHTVVFRATAKAQQLDEMRQMAEETGGQNLEIGNVQAAGPKLQSIARSTQALFWVTFEACDMPAAPQVRSEALSVELALGTKTGSSLAKQYSWKVLPQHQSACSAAAAPVPTVVAGASSATTGPSTARLQGNWPYWILGAVGAALIASGLVAWAFFARRSQAPATPVQRPPVPAPLPVGKPPWGNTRISDVYLGGPSPLEASLPERHIHFRLAGSSQYKVLRLTKSETTLGRHRDATIYLGDDDRLSNCHVTISLLADGSMFVTDNSTNGTALDGTRIPPGVRVRLLEGQVLDLANAANAKVLPPNSPGAAPQAPIDFRQAPPAPPAPPPRVDPYARTALPKNRRGPRA